MDFLTNPFITALLFLYQFLGQNIILSIVLFTVLVRLATYPLTAQQIKSSKEMQALQPKLKGIQEKYKGDRERLAQEQMKLYREHGINPMAGCLPLVIQLPILLGLYGAISHSLASTPLQLLELHHRIMVPGLSDMIPLQNKFLWLNLAMPDPTFILPVLVVVTTWLQSKLITPTPTSGDPKDPQAAMARNMNIMMPLMIGMFSLSFASGLSIYWVISNIMGVAQYAMMGKVDLKNLFGQPKVPSTTIENDPAALPAKKKPVSDKSGIVITTNTSSKKKSSKPSKAK
jgi:YidC/Oxa1 family membrane protein insertase